MDKLTINRKEYEQLLAARNALADTMRENERLKSIIKDLVERIDLNGGIGEYKGGKAFIMQEAREICSKS